MLAQKEKIDRADVGRLGYDRILLTGFRATGKSLVGRLLADRLGLTFLDTDTLLSNKFGCSLADFVTANGWDLFRQEEEALLRELCGYTEVVIATGGGAVLHQQAWQVLRRRSVSVWLQADEQTIERRLLRDGQSVHQRPSLTGLDPCSEIHRLLVERSPLYRSGSDFSVRTDGCSPARLVDEIELSLTLSAESMKNG